MQRSTMHSFDGAIMAKALDPRQQPHVNGLEYEAHRILRRIDKLNASLGKVLHEISELTGDPTLAQMADTTDKLHAEFRRQIQ
jgi:hypothetical protein